MYFGSVLHSKKMRVTVLVFVFFLVFGYITSATVEPPIPPIDMLPGPGECFFNGQEYQDGEYLLQFSPLLEYIVLISLCSSMCIYTKLFFS